MNKKLLSIVIPTRNREYYCISAIKNILSYTRDDFELVICDNSDSNQIEEFVSINNDNRLVYQHIKDRINSVINMDTAMRMATGEYLCMIGDDDTILPSIFDIVEWAYQNHYDNVTPLEMIEYSWPSDVSSGIIKWRNVEDKGARMKRTDVQLTKFLKCGLLQYNDYLPRIYHGLIRKRIMDKVLEKTGHMIGGLSPDIYMSIAASCIFRTFVTVNKPFTIAGACPRSYTSLDNNGKISLNIDDNPQLYKRGPYIWDNRIPAIKTSQTIWAESAIKAFEEMGQSHQLLNFNQGYLFADLIYRKRTYYTHVFHALHKTHLVRNKFIVWGNIPRYFLTKTIKRLVRKKVIVSQIYNISNIDLAVQKVLSSYS